MNEQLKVGDHVEVSGDAELGLMLGACRVVEVGKRHLVIVAPRFSAWWELNDHSVQLTRAAETGLYVGTARICAEEGHFGQLLRVAIVSSWRKVQRRQNVRLPANLRVRQALLLSESGPIALEATLVNISASGCLMRVSPLPPIDSRVRLTIEVPDAAPPIDVEAIAVRIEPEDRPLPRAGRIAVHFDEPPRRTQDRIVRFIFKEQIRRLQPK